jgi:uncharacterized membrane protein
MKGDHNQRVRSMLGTALFALAIIAAVVFVLTGAIWLIAAALISFAIAVVLLYKVGKSLS